jgi:phosphoglycerate kinase
MSDFKTLDDFEFDGKTVLVRADLNVPAKDGVVTDTTRIDRLAPTLTELSQAGAKVVVLSHFGRPKGGPDEKYSLKQVVDAVSKAVGQKVAFASDCVGPVAKEALAKIHPGAIIVMENLRFHPEEEKNDA